MIDGTMSWVSTSTERASGHAGKWAEDEDIFLKDAVHTTNGAWQELECNCRVDPRSNKSQQAAGFPS
jgi:hypothetical protein